MRLSIESHDVAEAEVSRIQAAFAKGLGTEGLAVKLIRAHLNLASDMAHFGTATPLMSKFAKASWGNVEEAEDMVEGAEFSLGTTILRHRLKSLAEMFGSTENLKAYENALKTNQALVEKQGVLHGKVLTETRDSTPQVQNLQLKVLYNILAANLQSKLVKFSGFQTCVTPVELCELIGLKMALKVQHTSMRVPDASAIDTMMRQIASWLQRRRDRHGTMRPEDLERAPEDRPVTDHRLPEEYLAVVDDEGKVISMDLNDGEVEVKEVTRSVKIAERRDPETHAKMFSMFKYMTDMVVEGSIKFLPLPASAPKDWDALSIGPKRPGPFVDRKRTPVNGIFPKTYSGPSFVFIESGRIVLPTLKCERCDGSLWYEWQKNGSEGECPKCKHVHVRPEMFREDHWEPRVWVTNRYVDDRTNEVHEVFSSFQGNVNMMACELTPSASGKTSKWKFNFSGEDMGASIFNAIYRNTVRGLLDAALDGKDVMSHHPILDETYVTNVFRRPKSHEIIWKDEDGVEHGRRNLRPTTLHLFVPVRMVAYMFDTRTLPVEWQRMHLQVQVSGKYEHLVDACNQLNGRHMRSVYTQASTKAPWVLNRQYWM